MFFLSQSDKYGRQHSEYICRINATSNSNAFIKMLNSTEATVSVPFNAGPMLAEIKMRHVNTSIAMCPANILAKKTDHQSKWLGKDTEEFNKRHHRHRYFQPPRHIRPEDIFPISFRSKQVDGNKCKRVPAPS